jgi:hypothetical protein
LLARNQTVAAGCKVFKGMFASNEDAWLWILAGLASLRVLGEIQAAMNVLMWVMASNNNFLPLVLLK